MVQKELTRQDFSFNWGRKTLEELQVFREIMVIVALVVNSLVL